MRKAAAEDEVLDEIVRRIVEVADPDKIILFGSRARGDAEPDSDYDLLVIGPSPRSHYKRILPIYRTLWGLGVAKDVIWWTPDEIEEWVGVRTHFINQVIGEGQTVYERAA